MRARHHYLLTIFTILIIVGMAMTACGPKEIAETPIPSLTSPPATGSCGDGVCDQAEQKNPNLCPEDCKEATAVPTAEETSPPPASPIPSQPNIVFILTDDLDAASLAYMPHMQALLAEQGTTFPNFFISMPLCCPSRATILRAQYGHNTQIMGNELPFGGFFKFYELGEEEDTIATWMQDAGYRTMLIGKYLNGFPNADDLMHIPAGWTEWYSPIDGDPYAQYNYVLNENGEQVSYGSEPQDYETDVYTQKTVDFIERSIEAGIPFFAHVSVYNPHWPTTPAPRHADLLADLQAPRTANFNEEDVSDKPSYIRDLPPLEEKDIAKIDEEWRQRLRSMQSVDEMIATIVDTLEASGQLENTYIFFTSDNGYHLGNHRQKLGKSSPYDEEIRVSLVVRGPGVPAGQTLDHMLGNIDLAPTWAELAGKVAPDFVDGRSMVPLLGSDPPALSDWRKCFLLEHAPFTSPGSGGGGLASLAAVPKYNTPAGVLEPPDPEDLYATGTVAAMGEASEALPYRGMRSADYLYVEYPTDEIELYDLRNDPYMLENIAKTADPALLSALAARLEELANCSGESCRAIEDAPLQVAADVPPEQAPPRADSPPLFYYLGYATEENMQWIQSFDIDLLTRGFLLFLNSSDDWLKDYQPRIQQLQAEGRQFLAAIQAAVLVEDAKDLPSLGEQDPALAYPMNTLSDWETYACRSPDGSILKNEGFAFAHACLNNPAYRAFLLDKLKGLVDAGVDGVHIDELPTRYFARHEGYCDDCMTGFRNHLADKYTPDQLSSLYNISDIQSFDFRTYLSEQGQLDLPPNSPLHKEWWQFQLVSLRQAETELLTDLRSYAQGQGKEFIITSNAYEPERNPQHVIEMTLGDYVSIGTGMGIYLRSGGQIVSEPRLPPNYSYLPLYRMAQAVTPDKPVTLFIDGPGGTGVMKELPQGEQADIVRWMFAEAYAAGAYFHVPYPSLDYYAPLEEVQGYVEFIQANRQLYEDTHHLADTGVLFSYASQVWDYWVGGGTTESNHSLQWYGLAQALTDLGIQYEAVFAADGVILPDELSLDDLAAYDRLIVPWVYALSDEHVSLLEEYARSGRELIVIGDFGVMDEQKNPASFDAVAALRAQNALILPKLNFEAYLNNPSSPDTANLLGVLSDLLPGRLVSVSNNAVSAQINQGAEAYYVHLINSERQESGFSTQQDFQVTLSLPSGLESTPATATYLSPDLDGEGALELPITRQGDLLLINVPQLEIYAVLVISTTD